MNTTVTIRFYFLAALLISVMAWGLCQTAQKEITKAQKRQAAQVEQLLGSANF